MQTKIDLKNVTFNIPIRIDSEDRAFNLKYIVSYLQTNFDTNIIIYENGPKKLVDFKDSSIIHIYEEGNGLFHRTRYLNEMARLSRTDYIVNYDCDVLFPIKQVVKAVKILRSNDVDFVYPYGGLFVNIPREALNNTFNVDELDPANYPNFGSNSVGGAILWNKKVFIKGGMENENFISWGAEDWERFRRFVKLGYNVGRVKGPLYHINHSRSINSNESNPNYTKNVAEFNRIVDMSKEELMQHISTWSWLSV